MSPSLEGGVGGLTEIPVSTLVALIVAPEQVQAERDPRLLELKRMVLATVRSLHSKRNYAKALDDLREAGLSVLSRDLADAENDPARNPE